TTSRTPRMTSVTVLFRTRLMSAIIPVPLPRKWLHAERRPLLSVAFRSTSRQQSDSLVRRPQSYRHDRRSCPTDTVLRYRRSPPWMANSAPTRKSAYRRRDAMAPVAPLLPPPPRRASRPGPGDGAGVGSSDSLCPLRALKGGHSGSFMANHGLSKPLLNGFVLGMSCS